MTRAADEHRTVAGTFTDRVRGVRAGGWDSPAPCEGWVARDVVRHLVEWFPAFLKAGAGVELPKGPSVDDDPVAAWTVHSDGVQALLDDPTTAGVVAVEPAHRRSPAGPGGRPVLHRRRLHAHLGPGAGDRAGRAARPGEVRRLLDGMLPMDEVLRGSGQYGPRVEVPENADVQTRLLAFIGRVP